MAVSIQLILSRISWIVSNINELKWETRQTNEQPETAIRCNKYILILASVGDMYCIRNLGIQIRLIIFYIE